VVTALLMLGACSGDDSPESSAEDTVTMVVVDSTSSTAAPTSGIDEAPALWSLPEAGRWIVEFMNGAPQSQSDYEERFDQVFRAEVPFDSFVALQRQLSARSPWVEVRSAPTGSSQTA